MYLSLIQTILLNTSIIFAGIVSDKAIEVIFPKASLAKEWARALQFLGTN